MAKKHYIIEAKGAEYISGNKITIEDCTYIEKNHRILEKNGKYRKINQEKISLSDRVINFFICSSYNFYFGDDRLFCIIKRLLW